MLANLLVLLVVAVTLTTSAPTSSGNAQSNMILSSDEPLPPAETPNNGMVGVSNPFANNQFWITNTCKGCKLEMAGSLGLPSLSMPKLPSPFG